MKKFLSEPKHLILFILGMIPYVVRVIFFRCGSSLTMEVLWPLILILAVINYRWLETAREFAVMQALMVLAGVISGALLTALYCLFVSNDPLSAPVGILMIILELIGMGLITGILILFKTKK